MFRTDRKIRTGSFSLLLIFFLSGLILCGRSVLAAGDRKESETENMLQLQAKAAVLMEAETGRVLYGKQESDFLPVASTTKIMTCLLALEQGSPEQLCKVSEYAAAQPEVRLGIRAGQRFFLRDLLYAMMLESDNDVAVVVAETIAGSEEAFAGLMNKKAKELGMTNTYFVTPNGLDRNGNGSCALDLARLARYALQNDAFLKIIATENYSFSDMDGKAAYNVTNHDAFLTQRKGALGIKTGFTGAAGYCFVGASWEEDRELIAVVLACGWPPNKTKKWSDMRTLLEYGNSQFSWKTLEVGSRHLAEIPLQNGQTDSVSIGCEEELRLLLRESDQLQIKKICPESLEAPLQEGEQVGWIEVWLNGYLQEKFPLVSEQSVKRKVWTDCLQVLLQLYLLGKTNIKISFF